MVTSSEGEICNVLGIYFKKLIHPSSFHTLCHLDVCPIVFHLCSCPGAKFGLVACSFLLGVMTTVAIQLCIVMGSLGCPVLVFI